MVWVETQQQELVARGEQVVRWAPVACLTHLLPEGPHLEVADKPPTEAVPAGKVRPSRRALWTQTAPSPSLALKDMGV